AVGEGVAQVCRPEMIGNLLEPMRHVSTFGVSPRLPDGEVDVERDLQCERAPHDRKRHLAHPVTLVGRHLDDDLVVDLQHESTDQVRVFERVVESNQGDLEDVSGQTLDAGIHRLPLARLTNTEVARRQLWDLAAPTEEGFGVPTLARLA